MFSREGFCLAIISLIFLMTSIVYQRKFISGFFTSQFEEMLAMFFCCPTLRPLLGTRRGYLCGFYRFFFFILVLKLLLEGRNNPFVQPGRGGRAAFPPGTAPPLRFLGSAGWPPRSRPDNAPRGNSGGPSELTSWLFVFTGAAILLIRGTFIPRRSVGPVRLFPDRRGGSSPRGGEVLDRKHLIP